MAKKIIRRLPLLAVVVGLTFTSVGCASLLETFVAQAPSGSIEYTVQPSGDKYSIKAGFIKVSDNTGYLRQIKIVVKDRQVTIYDNTGKELYSGTIATTYKSSESPRGPQVEFGKINGVYFWMQIHPEPTYSDRRVGSYMLDLNNCSRRIGWKVGD